MGKKELSPEQLFDLWFCLLSFVVEIGAGGGGLPGNVLFFLSSSPVHEYYRYQPGCEDCVKEEEAEG